MRGTAELVVFWSMKESIATKKGGDYASLSVWHKRTRKAVLQHVTRTCGEQSGPFVDSFLASCVKVIPLLPLHNLRKN